MIDQFISSVKKMVANVRPCNATSHGYEGQGPEHSSARLERLQASAEDNWIMANCTTPQITFIY